MQKLQRILASLSVVAVLSTLVVSTSVSAFTDVPEGEWYAPFVSELVEAGVVTEGETFRPGDDLNRAEAVKFLVEAFGLEGTTELDFSDVAEDDWYYAYVQTAVANGLVEGYEDGTFKGENGINRAEWAKVVTIAAGLPTCELESPFSDIPAGEWFEEFAVTSYCWMVMDGYDDGTFGGANSATRAEAAKMISSAMTPVERGADVVEDEEDVDDEDEDVVVVGDSDGTLVVEISSETPESANIPGLVENAIVAKYDFTAEDDDVTVTNVTFFRGGLNDDGSVVKVALFDADGTRVSKAKTFSTGDDSANVNLLGGGLTIEAGDTVTLSVVAEIGAATGVTNYSGQSFYMSIVDEDSVLANTDSIEGDFPIDSETMGIGSVDAAELQVLSDGVPASVKAGALEAKVAKLKIKNNDGTKKIEFSGITLKEEGTIDEGTDLANFVLYLDGKEVATTEAASGKYISFMLDEPIELASSKQITGYVLADVLGGASRYINFQVDSDLDVMAEDMTYGFGAQITATNFNTANDGSSAAKRVAVDAGEVTVVAVNAPTIDIRQNKDDVVLGTLRITVNAGQDLELQKLEVNIENVNANVANDSWLDDILENTEMYIAGYGTFDLAGAGANGIPDAAASDNFTNDDLGITLPDGKSIDVVIRADIRNTNQSATDLDMSKVDLTMKVQNIGTATKSTSDLYIIETDDDTAVTDITPSAVTFKTLNGVESTATVNKVTQSSIKTTVIGKSGLEALIYDVTAGGSSVLTMDGADVLVKQGAYTAADLTLSVAAATTDVINIDNSDCVVTFTNGATEDLDCSDNAATIDPAVYATAVAQVGRLSLLTGLTNYDVTAGASTSKFRLIYNNATPIVTAVTQDRVAAAANHVYITALDTVTISAATAINVGTIGFANNASNTYVTKVSLYKDSVSEGNLLDSVSGSQLSSGVASFDGFELEVGVNETKRFYVTFDIVNDENQQYDVLKAYLNTLSLKDTESDEVTAQYGGIDLAAGAPVISDRTVSIRGAGSLSVVVDNTDPSTDQTKLALGGATSDFVASYELTATNEDILVKSLRITGNASFDSYVSEVVLYKEDLVTEIARKSVNSTTVNFTDINYVASQGTENIFVKVVAHKMGKDEAGSQSASDITMTFRAIDSTGSTAVEGYESNKAITAGYGVAAVTDASNGFKVVPVHVKSVAFVSSEGGESVNAKLVSGDNTIAIVKVETDASLNKKTSTGGALMTYLTQIAPTQSRLTGTDQTLVTAYTIKRIGTATAAASLPAAQLDTIVVDTNVTVTAKSFGDTGITVAMTDDADASNDCGAATVTAGAVITVGCDTTGTATKAMLEAALEATGLVDVTVAAPGALGAAFLAAAGTLAGGSDTLTFDMDTLFTEDYKITNGTTAYYVIKATVTKDNTNDTDDYLKLEFDNLGSSDIIYASDDSVNNTAITDARLEYTSVAGTQINE